MPKFFLKRSSDDINIEKEDIFYRDKYNEIINYIKALISDSESLEFYKYMKPKGNLLINVNPGTDIMEFLKVISKNYYLDIYELDSYGVSEESFKFIKEFGEILANFGDQPELVDTKENLDSKKDKTLEKSEDNKKSIILINQEGFYSDIFDQKSLIEEFIRFFRNNQDKIDFLSRSYILIWISYDYAEIVRNSSEINQLFDLVIKIPIITKVERETILRNYCEENPNISFDIGTIANQYTENWEVVDLKRLIKKGIFKHYLNADLNEISNEITDIIVDLIESGEYIPISKKDKLDLEKKQEKILNNNGGVMETVTDEDKKTGITSDYMDNKIKEIMDLKPSEFMLNQLYENAASKNYNQLVIIIDKLNKNEPLRENDRKILSQYPFILSENPNKAQINLEKAKKSVDLMIQAFKKEKKEK